MPCHFLRLRPDAKRQHKLEWGVLDLCPDFITQMYTKRSPRAPGEKVSVYYEQTAVLDAGEMVKAECNE